MGNIVKYVRGNTMLLVVTLTEKLPDETSVPVDVTVYDSWAANVYRFGTTSKIKASGVQAGVDEDLHVTLILPPTLPCGVYSVEIVLSRASTGRRTFEIPVFEIVETNGEADVTYDLIEGMRSADIDMQFQFVETDAIIGENAYEEWKKLPGNEDKTMQDFIDEVLDLYGVADRANAAAEHAETAAVNAEHLPYIGSDNYVYEWNGSRYVKTSTYVKGDKGDKGDTGAQGSQGIQGPQGPAGVGVPAGGATGQVLKKKSNSDFDTEWGEGGSGTQVQSDWNETDTTDPAYIKNKPTIPSEVTESTVAGWGFTKNTGTITGITMNGASKGTSGVVNLGDVVTDVSGKVDKTTTINGKALSSNVTLTASDVGALPADTPIPVVPTNVSAFNNDAGYLTSHQDISGKEDKVDIVSASGATLTAEVGKYYTLSNVGTLAITLPTIAAGTTKVQTLSFYIAAGSTPAVTFTSTHSIYYSDGFEIAADSTYEVSALWNGLAWVVASVKIVTSNS